MPRSPFALAPFALLALFSGCVCRGSHETPSPSLGADVAVTEGEAPAPAPSPSASEAPPPEPPSASDVATAAELETARAACERFRGNTRRRVERLMKRYGDPGDKAPATLAGYCEATPKGTWRIGLGKLEGFDEGPVGAGGAGGVGGAGGLAPSAYELVYQLETRLDVSFTPPGGKAAHFVVPKGLSNYGQRTSKVPWLFDYDGDGLPEFYLQIDEEGSEGHRARVRHLLTYRGGALTRYQPAAVFAYEEARDVDGDGRPDLLLLAGYSEALEACASTFPYDHAEPKFVAHALPDGSFSADDAGAKAAAARWCFEPPAAITSSYDAICARLWAGSPGELASARALVRASCVPLDCEREMAGTPQRKGAAADCERRLAWFEKRPPFTLP